MLTVVMSNSDSEDTSPGLIKRSCGSCKQFKSLVIGKSYCHDCAATAYRECSRCKLVFPSAKYFEQCDRRCNPCQVKYLKERERRLQRQKTQQQQQATATTTTWIDRTTC